jgi:hypothetical protein
MWKIIFAVLAVLDITTVGVPIIGIYFGSSAISANALSFVIDTGTIVGFLNFIAFGAYIIIKRPRELKLLICLFGIAVSVYYCISILA